MRVASLTSRFVCRAAVAAALVVVVVSAGAARAATSEFTRIGVNAAIEVESVPPLPDLTALKSGALTELSRWSTSRPLMQQMFKQREIASKTTPDRRMLYLINQTTPEPLGDLQFWTLQLIGFQVSQYSGIWVGQPDASYAQITPVAARRILTSNDLDGAEPAFARYATSLSAEMTLVEALQKSLGRYQGADAGENGAWALVHARAIRDYASALAAQLDQTTASMQLMRFVFDSDPRPIDAQIAVLKEWRDRVAADGEFSVDELREAANLGLSENQLVGMKFNLLADEWGASRASVVAHMDELIAAHAALKPTLLALATDMTPLIAELEADPLVPDLAPVANAGGPYSGAQGATISFNAGASTSPSAIAAYEWDLDGDGAFDDATGVSPTSSFSTMRNSTVGVRVTNAAGEEDVAYARLEVTAGSGGGVILDGFSPFRVGSQFIGEASVRVGQTQQFSVTATANSYGWLLDGIFTGTSGQPYDLTPTSAQIGPHVVKVVLLGLGNASLSIRWDVAVLAPDGDGDLWNANADCDDTDAAVHPLRDEVLGNGKDDDCNPATPDASTTRPPVATDVSLTTTEDTPIGVTLAGTDADGNPLAGGPTSDPAHGGFVDGVYTPDPNFHGTDSFTFAVVDGHGGSGTGTVTITVTPVNDPPVAVADSYTTNQEGILILAAPGVLANDTDVEGDTLEARLVDAPTVVLQHFALRADGAVDLRPLGAFEGTVTFTYRTVDAGGAESEPATVTVTVKAVNHPPFLRPLLVSTDEDTPLTLAEMAAFDGDGDPLTITASQPSHGSYTGGLNGVYTPDANYNGPDSFTYTAADGRGGTGTATVDIVVRPVNDAPTVADRSVTTPQDTAVAIALTGTDIDGDTLTFTSSSPFHGAYDGTTYTPTAGYSGPDLFTYTASDGHGGSATAVVSITVTPVNPPSDTTPPSCEIVEQGKTAAGNPFIRFRVTEVGLGLARHELGYLLNTSVLVEPYAVGSLGPVTVTATAINKRKSMAVEVFFYDLAGNRALCDPIVMSIQRLVSKPQDEVLRNVPDTDHRVTVTNGSPGMRKVVLLVNGRYFGQHRLKPGEVRKFTIGTAMKPGYVNTIRVRANGPKGAKATIVIANIP